VREREKDREREREREREKEENNKNMSIKGKKLKLPRVLSIHITYCVGHHNPVFTFLDCGCPFTCLD